MFKKVFLFTLIAFTSNSFALEFIPSKLKKKIRLEHAKQILGLKSYNRNLDHISKNYHTRDEIIKFLKKRVGLKRFRKIKGHTIINSILKNTWAYNFDPMFILAVIENESSYNAKIKGDDGEIGPMQILPKTAKWISDLFGIDYSGKDELYSIEKNIEIGMAYLYFLKSMYEDDGRKYITAYNMGPGNLKKSLEKNIRPKDYSNAVMQRYVSFF